MVPHTTDSRHTTAPDTPLVPRPSREDGPPIPNRGAVLVPVELLRAGLTAHAVAVWVLLAEHARQDRTTAWPSRDTLARRIGARDLDTVTRSTAALEAAGWLTVKRVHDRAQQRTRNTYTVHGLIAPEAAGEARDYVEVTRTARAALEEGRITAARLLALARWLADIVDEQKRKGGPWTLRTAAEHAEEWGVHAVTARRERAALVAVGLLDARTEPGRPTLTAAPGDLPQPRPPRSTKPVSPVAPNRFDPEHETGPEVTTLEVTTLEVTTGGAAGRRPLTVRSARRPEAPAASREKPRPNPDPAPSSTPSAPLAGEVLAALPAGYTSADRWVRRHLLRMLTEALDAYGPAAIHRAVWRHDDNLAPLDACPTLRAALAGLAADVLAGACRDCGQDPEDPHRDLCPTCHPDRLDLTPTELAALADLAAGLPDRMRAAS